MLSTIGRYKIFQTFRSLSTKFEGMEDEDGRGERARKLAALLCCPTCDKDCEVALPSLSWSSEEAFGMVQRPAD